MTTNISVPKLLLKDHGLEIEMAAFTVSIFLERFHDITSIRTQQIFVSDLSVLLNDIDDTTEFHVNPTLLAYGLVHFRSALRGSHLWNFD